MKIRLTRKGDAFAISKPDKGAGVEEDEAEDVPQNTGAAAGLDQDMADVEPSTQPKERSPDGDNKRRRLSSPPPDDNNVNVDGPPSVKDASGADPEPSAVQETSTEAASEAKNANDVKDAKGVVPASSEPSKVETAAEALPAGTAESKLPQGPVAMDISPAKSGPLARTAPEQNTPPVQSSVPLPPKVPPAAEPLNRELYRIPSYAAWFSWNKIHNLERRALGLFFDGKSASKTPKIYKEYRDFMINKYRENSQRRLTFTEVRKMLVGDVNTLQKVFDFLEHWGLINNQVSADARKQLPGVIAVEPGPASLRSYPEVRAAGLQHPDGGGGSVAHSYPSLASHKDIFGAAGAQRLQTARPICTVCKAICSKERYQRQGQAAVVLCPNCLKGEKYGPGLSAADFTLVTTETKEDWSQQETLLLLEGITRYGDNWSRVADHVGTKSKGECVMQFIGLPFGDRMLGDIEFDDVPHVNGDFHVKPPSTSPGVMKTNQQQSTKANVGKVHSDEDGVLGHNSGSSMQSKGISPDDLISPLLDASNPLMGQVAFLSSMVGPRVAAAAAQAAVTAITEEEATPPVFPSSSHTTPVDTAPFHSTSSREVSDVDLRPKEELSVQGGQSGGDVHIQDPQSFAENANMALPPAVPARMSIATALGVAAANAKLLADQEEREMESLLADIIDNQFKKLQSKLEHFEELEMLLEKERIEVERARTQVYADRIRFAEFQFGSSRIPNGEVRQNDTLHSTRPTTSPVPQRATPGIASKLTPTRKI